MTEKEKIDKVLQGKDYLYTLFGSTPKTCFGLVSCYDLAVREYNKFVAMLNASELYDSNIAEKVENWGKTKSDLRNAIVEVMENA